MVKFWGRKSSVVEDGVDRVCEGATGGGLKIREQKIQSNILSGSSDSIFTASDKYLSEAGHIRGSSIKQLLSYEMSTESEQKRRSPSIIARLMGFEGLSAPEPAHKHCPNNQITSQSTSSKNCSRVRTSKLQQQQQFKDVYEVSESVNDENQRYQSRRIATSDISEAEMAFLRKRFIDVKRLVTDETCQGSKEFNDALEDLQSNKHLFLRLLQEPESISANQQHDSRRANPCSGRRTCFEESVGDQNHANKDIPINLRRDSLRNLDSGTPHSRKISNNLRNSKKWLNVSDDISAFPTKIVVLKPNIRRMQLSEPESDVLSCVSEFESCNKVQNMRIQNTDQRGKKHFSNGLQIPKHKTGESRELAKRITEKMRCSLHSRSLDFSHYNGDGSSSDESENDSSYGSGYVSFRRYKADRNKVAQSGNTSSSANKEGKKRLSERWKMTNRFQEVGLSKRSTLGEMLSVPESRKESKIVILAGRSSTKDRRLHNPEEQAWPLGISSRDGWKYNQVSNLSKSTSVPAACNSRGVFESPMRRKLPNDYMHLQRMPLKDSREYINELPRHNTGLNDRSRRSRSNRRHSKIAQETLRDEYFVSQANDDLVHDVIPTEKEIIAPEELPLNAELMINEIQDAQPDTLAMSSIPTEDYEHGRSVYQPEFRSPQHEPNIISTQNLSDNNCKDYSTSLNTLSVSPESSSKSKDAEQPSPMSILGVNFLDELSSGTECFGSLTADLQGLRMQLQLLKQESEGYTEGSITISSSEDDESVEVSEKKPLMTADSLDSSYIIDALTNIGFYDTDPYIFMTKWHSPDHPMSPAEFKKLEEKYGKQTSWSRSERRILFDLINSGLVEVFKPFHDTHPWVKQSFCRPVLSPSVDIEGLEEKLLSWLQVQITQEMDRSGAEKAAVKELEWYEPAGYMEQVGSEVEELLTDELIAEIFDMWWLGVSTSQAVHKLLEFELGQSSVKARLDTKQAKYEHIFQARLVNKPNMSNTVLDSFMLVNSSLMCLFRYSIDTR